MFTPVDGRFECLSFLLLSVDKPIGEASSRKEKNTHLFLIMAHLTEIYNPSTKYVNYLYTLICHTTEK